MDQSKTPEQRADALLAVMTDEQKDQLLYGSGSGHQNVADQVAGIPELCIPDQVLNDAGQGLGSGQRYVTAFPSPIVTAASWNRSLAGIYARTVAQQALARGINVWLAPGMNIARVPTNGRNFEYGGEDPYLTSQITTSVVRGAQGEHVIATAKHYALNEQETDRNTASSDVDERTLHEIYLPPFEDAVVRGGIGSVMCAYNRVESVYACSSHDILTKLLKQELGFTGYVMSDWGATHAATDAAAGLDQEHQVGGGGNYLNGPLLTAVANGDVSRERFNDMARRVLLTMFRVGLFDHPASSDDPAGTTSVDTPEARATARKMSEQGSVLLKNDDRTLPLKKPGTKIALIGLAAGPTGAQMTYNGGGSSRVENEQVAGAKTGIVSPFDGISNRAKTNGDSVTYVDGSATADAVAAASTSDVAIVFSMEVDSEAVDRPDLTMSAIRDCIPLACPSFPVDQDNLIASVAAANPNTIVVLNTGGPVLMPWLPKVKSVLQAWYPGEDNGNAMASLLFGDVNPSGRLPVTFPLSEDDVPTAGMPARYPGVTKPDDDVGPHTEYSEGLDVGYRWYDAKRKGVLFPFGFGLSYTTFSYANYDLRRGARAGTATVSFDVTNTGDVPGATVAEVYVGAPAKNYVDEPPNQLRAFQKTRVLKAGQSQHISLKLDARSVSYWDSSKHSWQPETGCHPVWVGASSRDVQLKGSGLTGDMRVKPGCAASAPTRSCTKRRTVTVHVRGLRGAKPRRITVYVNGRRVRVQRGGSKIVKVRLRGVHSRKVRVRLVIRTRSGRKVVERRTYRLCA